MHKLKYNKNISEFRIQFNEYVAVSSQTFYIKKCQCYAIHDYYPISGIGYDVDCGIADVRRFIFHFKDGQRVDVEYAANIIVKSIKKREINLENTCLMIIPASKPEKTNKRFQCFCSLVAKALGIENGFNYLSAVEHKETKGCSNKCIIPYVVLHPESYNGKNILLFDDVITSGTSFKQIAAKLLETGARSVTGIFLAKTTRE